MTDAPGESVTEQGDAQLRAFAEAVSSDLAVIAALHDCELSAAVVAALQAAPAEQQLGLTLKSEAALSALAALALAVEELPKPVDQHALDELAAAYADVYLRFSYRASPEESVWLTEDGLQRQAPMFEVREWYRRNNLKATDWASRPDDHLVIELRFMSELFARAQDEAGLIEAARFLDAHPQRWVKRFAIRLVQANAPNFYAALALLTASYLDEVRDYLTEVTGHARPAPEPLKPKSQPPADGEPAAPYVPGLAPSW